MEEAFFSFYEFTDEKIKQLFNEGLVVVDTNILINLFEVSKEASDNMLNTLKDKNV